MPIRHAAMCPRGIKDDIVLTVDDESPVDEGIEPTLDQILVLLKRGGYGRRAVDRRYASVRSSRLASFWLMSSATLSRSQGAPPAESATRYTVQRLRPTSDLGRRWWVTG